MRQPLKADLSSDGQTSFLNLDDYRTPGLVALPEPAKPGVRRSGWDATNVGKLYERLFPRCDYDFAATDATLRGLGAPPRLINAARESFAIAVAE